MRKMVQIRGCMGSGKTTIARSYMSSYNFVVDYINIQGKEYPYSYDAENNVIFTGRYDKNVCGGVDGKIKNRQVIKEYLYMLIKTKQPKLIVFEAVMYGITFKFSYELNAMCQKLGYEYTAIAPIAGIDILIERIMKRNGGKPFNIESLARQYTRYIKSTEELKNAGVDVRIVNTENVREQEMSKILEDVI